jgi:hypothetical protein
MKRMAMHLAACALALAGCGSTDDGPSKLTVAVIGDVPYGTTPTDTTQSVLNPGLIAALNADVDAQVVLHVGDIHSGKQYCTEAYDNQIANDWKALKKPMVYTPGDNEWTDCNKSGEGGGVWNTATSSVDYVFDATGNKASYQGGDPLANLDLVRRIFFAQPGKDFTGTMDVHTQAREFDAADPGDAAYVENVWFEKSGVLFVTINMPGGSNNDTDPWYAAPAMSAAQSAEVTARSGADLRWLDTAFKRAASNADYAMVIQLQADMWDQDNKTPSHIAQYKPFVDAIASKAKDFGKPVLLLNGDSHTYRSDNPLVQGAACTIEPSPGASAVACAAGVMPAGNPVDPYANQPNGYNVANFHRIVVHGSTTPLEWLKLTLDPGYDRNAAATATSFGPFSWTRVRAQ